MHIDQLTALHDKERMDSDAAMLESKLKPKQAQKERKSLLKRQKQDLNAELRVLKKRTKVAREKVLWLHQQEIKDAVTNFLRPLQNCKHVMDANQPQVCRI